MINIDTLTYGSWGNMKWSADLTQVSQETSHPSCSKPSAGPSNVSATAQALPLPVLTCVPLPATPGPTLSPRPLLPLCPDRHVLEYLSP